MNFKVGDKVVVVKPTLGLPAFSVTGRIHTVEFIDVEDGYTWLTVTGIVGGQQSSRFEKYETHHT